MSDTIAFPPYITLQADNNQFLSRWGNNGLMFKKSDPDEYCSFKVEVLGTNEIALQADNGQWFTRWGPQDLECHKDSIDEYCHFRVINLGENKIGMRGDTGKWVSRWDNGIAAAKTNIDQYCHFKIGEPIINKEIRDVEYDTGSARIDQLNPLVALNTNVQNPSNDITITQTLEYSYEKSETGTWNNTFGVEIGVSTEFKTGVPFIAEGKIAVSVTTSYSHEFGGSTGKTKTVNSSTQVAIPPRTKAKAKVMILQASISVPFTYKTRRTYITGRVDELPGSGVYNNVESYTVNSEVYDQEHI